MRAKLLGLMCTLTAACGPSHHVGPDETTAVLTIDPPSSELTITNAVPVTEDFTATLTYADGTTKDVTAETSFVVDFGGKFTDHTLTALGAGKLEVSAAYSAKAASAIVLVHAHGVRIDPTLPANTQDLFNGTEVAARAPTVVYPPAEVVVPRNLGDFEIHWTDSSSNDIFEISLHTDLSDVRVYVPGGNGMAAAGAGAGWSAFLSSEWQAVVGTEDTVTYQVRAVNSADLGAGVGAGQPRLVKLSRQEMNGGIYYWASRGTTSPEGVWRHDMAKPGQPAEQYMTQVQTNGRCVACHVISRDGTRMAITYDGGNGAANMIDVGTKALGSEANAWNFGAFTPDGNQYLSVRDGVLVVRDYATQAIQATMTVAGTDKVTHPDVSADGTMLAYVRVPSASYGADWHFGHGAIYVRSYDQATKAFGPETLLVSDAMNNYYPSFSPDGKYVLFNKSSDNSLNGAYNNPSASVWVIKTDGTGPQVELATLNAALGKTNSWARWAPFEQTVGTDPVYWITASSQRDFGTRLVGLSRPQIWMTAFSPAAVEAATDPSSPTFRLPFQNLDSNNHIAQWTEQIVVTQ